MPENSNKKFTHLHVHSHYSLLDGLAKIDELLDRAKEMGMDSLALTDHGVMYGAVEFSIKAKERGIKPIIGCEMYVSHDLTSKNNTALDRKMHHLTLLVKDEDGYKNLMHLVSIAHLEGFYYKPRIDKKTLRKYSTGLIAMSGCLAGEIPNEINNGNYEKARDVAREYEQIFGKGNFFMELQHHPNNNEQKNANKGMLEISKKTGIPVVATGDIHYVNKEDAEIQDILLCIQTNRKVQEKNRMSLMDFDLSMKSPEEMQRAFKNTPEAIANTQEIVNKCDFHIKLGETQLPHFDVPDGYTDVTYLRHLTEKGLEKKYQGNITQEHRDRMEYELKIIEKTGFPSYFLIVQDFVNWAKQQGIVVGPGRGSAAGSFVSYLIGITNVDPIKYDLLFERFLNPERISMPDVDMDFADNRRDEVLDYVRKKYGHDHVAQIITFGTMAARAAIRDAGRALGLEYSFCDRTAKMIPMFSDIAEALEDAKEFKQLYESDPNGKKLIDSAKKLEGVARHASMHACGVVITKEPVTAYSPLQTLAKGGDGLVTQYSSSTKSSYVEKIGLLKMDFLGLKNLTIIQNTLNIVRKTKGLEIDIENIPLDDKKTYELLQHANTTGVFQLESSGMKRYLKQLMPNNLEDVIAMVALYRPGPMDWIPDFIARKHGLKKITYLHPKLEPILKKTYGVAVYQEQVMQMAQQLAGFTLGEADVLRKAVGKKILNLIQEQKIKFVEGCVKNGIDKKTAENVFAFIEPFAGYGFNRCLDGDTLITDAKSGKQFRLEELYNWHNNKKKLPEILTLKNDLKLGNGKITKVFFNGTKDVFKIKTALGKTIKATANHPLLTISGWKKLEEIKAGERIAMARNLPLNFKGIKMEKYKLIILGYLLAEGNLCHPHSFYFYSKNKAELKEYTLNLQKFKNTKATVNKSKPATSIYAGRINLKEKSGAVDWIKSIGIHGKRATEKEIPELAFKLDSEDLSLLIGKMFQGDGCVSLSRKYPQIFYATSSKKMAHQLQHLLLRLNIIGTIHKKKFKYKNTIKIGYTLTINRYNNIENFYKGPGKYLIGEKLKNIKQAVKNHPIINGQLKNYSARGSRDIIPSEIIEIIRKEIINAGYSAKEFSQEYNFAERLFFKDKRKVGFLRETVFEIGKILKSKKLLELGSSDIYWDKIISIEKSGRKKTYDLTIESTHNFVANDFVVHNSHAACYGLIGYQTAYLKAHYPAEFMAALMTSDQDNIERIAIEVDEAKHMGIEVLPPDVNESFEEFAVVKGTDNNEKIRFGLNAIKNVGKPVAHEIVAERKRNGKYAGLGDMLERITIRDLNKKSIEALAKVGALDQMAERNQILENIETILAFSKNIQKNKNYSQTSLFGEEILSKAKIQLEPAAPAEKKEKLQWEKELLGLYVSGHPVSDYQEYFNQMAIPVNALNQNMVGQMVKVGGVISAVKKIITKRHQEMMFATIEDLKGKIELLIFPKTLERIGSIWQEDRIVLVEGKLSDKDGVFKILAEDAKEINQQELESFKRVLHTQKSNGHFEKKDAPIKNEKLTIILPPESSQMTLKNISDTLGVCKFGKTRIYLSLNESKMETSYSVAIGKDLIEKIEKTTGAKIELT